MNRHASRGRIGLASVVGLGAVIAFALLGGTSIAGGLAKPAKGQYGGQYNNASKVTVCHKAKVTIRIGAPAVKAHQAHGDSLGACALTASTSQKAPKPKKSVSGQTSSSVSTATSNAAHTNNGKAKGKSKA